MEPSTIIQHSVIRGLGRSESFTMASEAQMSLSQLEDASIAMNINSDDDKSIQVKIQELLDEKKWIYHSQGVVNLLKKLDENQLYSVFDSQHHIKSAIQLFQFLKDRDSCVLYGHKPQGKSQFLFFVFKLLCAMGQKVLFLDHTMLPTKSSNKVKIRSFKFCGHLWRDSILQIDDQNVQDNLKQFLDDGRAESFGEFFAALSDYSESSGDHVWIVVDDVVLFENFPIDLPREQDMGPFNWIVTGSADFGTWVGRRHLDKFAFDLPLFTAQECLDCATKLCDSLDIDLENGLIGVPRAGLGDWLEEQFGGIIGYIAELFLEISKGKRVSEYLSSLDARVEQIIVNVAKGSGVGGLASDLLKGMNSASNDWIRLCNAGGEQESDFYVSPTRTSSEQCRSSSKKRRITNRISTSVSPRKERCCHCTIGDYTKCKCGSKHKRRKSHCMRKRQNDQKW